MISTHEFSHSTHQLFFWVRIPAFIVSDSHQLGKNEEVKNNEIAMSCTELSETIETSIPFNFLMNNGTLLSLS